MRRYNIALIVLDTLRADHAQGLDKLLDLGFVKYEDVYATAPWTLPSHASMFTGMYPSEHGIHETREYYPPEIAKVARLRMAKLNRGILGELRGEGYSTYILSANIFISSNFGFNADHEYLVDPLTSLLRTSQEMKLRQHYSEPLWDVVLKLLKNNKIDYVNPVVELLIKKIIHVFPKFVSENAVKNKGGKKL